MTRDEQAAIAKEMRELSPHKRDEAIEAAGNVLDARAKFEHRRRQVIIARQYRKAFSRRGPVA